MQRLLALLDRQVAARFSRLSGAAIQAVALPVYEPDLDAPTPNPSHPACADFASSDYCRESWQLHLARLKQRPEIHWGVCEKGRLCAIVPILHGRRCLAVLKLAGPAKVETCELRRLLELADLLIRDFTAAHADFLGRVPGGLVVNSDYQITTLDDPPLDPPPVHPQVIRAIAYIREHYADPQVNVATVAAALDVCPTYLSELFVEQTGQRMGRFIAARRIERAARLLVETDWQVKRIAIESGHANPNWFCHVFKERTGLTPREYRATVQARGLDSFDRATGG